jgi:hypothetical protein
VKNTSSDEGDKPERVYKYNDWAMTSDSEDSEELSPRRRALMTSDHPGCLERLFAGPCMCMI